MDNKLKAVFWDYDGTLVDTRFKNYHVTCEIISDVTGKDARSYNVLSSFESYKNGMQKITNWRALYQKELGLNQEETDRVGSLWTQYQLNDTTPTPLLKGIKEVIAALGKYAQGIISQNSKTMIGKVLQENEIKDYFDVVIGYEEVHMREQKPHPSGMLQGISKLDIQREGTLIYIGDHESDVIFSRNTEQVLRAQNSRLKIMSIGAHYGNERSTYTWNAKPDFLARETGDLVSIIKTAIK